MSNIIFVDI